MTMINAETNSGSFVNDGSYPHSDAQVMLSEYVLGNGRVDTLKIAERLKSMAETDPQKAESVYAGIQSALASSGNVLDRRHLEQDIALLLKRDNSVTKGSIEASLTPAEFVVLPPYQVATYPNEKFATPTYVNPESLHSITSEWEGLGTLENSVWGAFKALTVMRGGELLKIGPLLSGAGGTATAGATTENLFVQMRTTTYIAEVSDWRGDVYYGPFGRLGEVKAIDFHELYNTREMTLEVTREYRVMAGDEVIYASTAESITPSKVKDFIPNENGFPTHDVYPKY